MGATGDLPDGVSAINFFPQTVSEDPTGGIAYSLLTNESVQLAILATQLSASDRTPTTVINVQANKYVNGSLTGLGNGVFDIWLGTTTFTFAGPEFTVVWTELEVPAAEMVPLSAPCLPAGPSKTRRRHSQGAVVTNRVT